MAKSKSSKRSSSIVPTNLRTFVQPSKIDGTLASEARIKKLNDLYSETISKGTSLVELAIQIGECVSGVIADFETTSGKGTAKENWEVLHDSQKLPFKWNQALRYKRIAANADLARSLGSAEIKIRGGITVECVYSLIGEQLAQVKGETTVQVDPEFDGVVAGVSGQRLKEKKAELQSEIEKAHAEIEATHAKIEQLRSDSSSLTKAMGILKKETALTRATISEKSKPVLSRAGELVPEVGRYVRLVELCRASAKVGAGTRIHRWFKYRKWLLAEYAGDPDTLIARLTAYCEDPEKAWKSDEVYSVSTTDWDSQFKKLTRAEKAARMGGQERKSA